MAENVKIAVIDDRESTLQSLKLALEIKDYEVDLFERGLEFLDKFKKDQYDVIFLDLLLEKDPPPYNNKQKMDGGILILQKIKEIDPDVEVIILTGYATERTHSNAITFGAMEYLNKPPMIEEIYELVERALRKKRSKKVKKKGAGPLGPIH